MSTTPEDLFRKAVATIFNGWTALQLAVEHGMGGSDSHAKAVGLIDSVVDLFKNKSNVDWQDIADLLTDLMDEEFDTVCEDDSCDEVGFMLSEFYKLCIAGNVESVEAEILKLPSAGHWLSKSIETTPKVVEKESLSNQENASEENSDKKEDMVVDTEESTDPGWTTVSRRRK